VRERKKQTRKMDNKEELNDEERKEIEELVHEINTINDTYIEASYSIFTDIMKHIQHPRTRVITVSIWSSDRKDLISLCQILNHNQYDHLGIRIVFNMMLGNQFLTYDESDDKYSYRNVPHTIAFLLENVGGKRKIEGFVFLHAAFGLRPDGHETFIQEMKDILHEYIEPIHRLPRIVIHESVHNVIPDPKQFHKELCMY
jgi:hypothetical protein